MSKAETAEQLTDPQEAAHAAGLRYVNDTMPGIRRKRAGKSFAYVGPDGNRITDPDDPGGIGDRHDVADRIGAAGGLDDPDRVQRVTGFDQWQLLESRSAEHDATDRGAVVDMESVARDLGHETADPNEGADMAAELGEVEI